MTSGVKDGPVSSIAIGPDDTLVDVFDRIRAAGQTPVELRIPNESSLFLTAAEFRTLRDVADHGRHLVSIRTPDSLRLQLAKLFGLDVSLAAVPVAVPPRSLPPDRAPASTEREPTTPPARPTRHGAGTAGEQSEPPKTTAAAPPSEEPVNSISESEAAARWPEVVVHKPVPAAPRRLLDRVSAVVAPLRPVRAPTPEPAAEEAPEAEADGSAAGEATERAPESGDEAPEPSKIHWVGDRRPAPVVLTGAALLLALISVLVFLLPSARVRLDLASVPINSELLFDVTASGQPLDDRAAFALPGEPAELTVVYEASIPTTGVETIPDQTATGTVLLANPTAAPITVEAGTILTTEAGTEFAVIEAVEVPAAGQAEAAIAAIAPGTSGNAGMGEVGGRLPNGVYYSNRQAATAGGTDQEVPVVVQADLDALLAQADDALLGLVEADAALGGTRAVVAPSLSVLDATDTFDQAAGAEAETVSLRAERTVSVLTYDEAALSERLASALGDQLRSAVPVGFELGPVAIGADDVSAVEGSSEGGRFRVAAEASAALALTEETERELAGRLAGKSPEEVSQILSKWPEVTSFEVEPGFRLFTSNMPANAGRIEIDDGT